MKCLTFCRKNQYHRWSLLVFGGSWCCWHHSDTWRIDCCIGFYSWWFLHVHSIFFLKQLLVGLGLCRFLVVHGVFWLHMVFHTEWNVVILLKKMMFHASCWWFPVFLVLCLFLCLFVLFYFHVKLGVIFVKNWYFVSKCLLKVSDLKILLRIIRDK